MKSQTYKDQTDRPSSESNRQDAARPAQDETTKPRPPQTPVRDSDRTSDTPNRDDDELVADEDADDDDQFEDDDDDGDDDEADGDAAPTGETDEA